MKASKSFLIILALLTGLAILAGCQQTPTPGPVGPTPAPTGAPVQPTLPPAGPTSTAPTAITRPTPSTQKLASLAVFPQVDEPLKIVLSQPAEGAEGTAVDKDAARVVVQFNHPVVPLVSVDEQSKLPSPITIEPATSGKGEWLNTSTYAFTPDENLKPSTKYTVRVQPGLKDLVGGTLADGYSFSFTSAFPGVGKTYPEENAIYVSTTQPITVTFNQPVDQASAQSAFKLAPQGGGAPIGGSFAWADNSMAFTPGSPLAYDAGYVATVAAGVKSATGEAASRGDYAWRFKTAPRPSVVRTRPADGEEKTKAIRDGFQITFAAPMNTQALTVTVEPTITRQSVSWEESDTRATVMGGWLASRTYTVTIKSTSESRYGDPLGKDTVVRFTAAPLDPAFSLNTASDTSLFNAYQDPIIYATGVNLDKIDFSLYRVSRDDLIQLMGENRWQLWEKYVPPKENQLRTWSVDTRAGIDAARRISTTLATAETPLEPGIYMVRATSPQVPANSVGVRHLAVVSKVNLAFKRTDSEALVWVTDLQSGKPVAGQPITVFDPTGKPVANGETDADGVYRGTFPQQAEPWRPMFALSEVGGKVVAAVTTEWAEGIGPWEFGIPYNPQPQKYYATMYTDRPIYRPAQTVYFRGVLRVDDDGKYSLPDLQSVPVTVRDSQGKELLKTELKLSSFGTFNGEVQLSPAAPLGYYNIEVAIGPEGPTRFFAGQGFQVAAYRKPEYQVDVTTDKPEYVQGETIDVSAQATYFFGGPVAGGKVQWRLLKDDYFFRPDTIKGWWDFTDYDASAQRATRQGEVVTQGQGTTDGEGKFSFQVPANVADYPLSQNFTLDVEITDVNNQAVSNRVSAVVHKGAYYPGLRPQQYVGTVGDEQAVDVVVLDTKGATVPNQPVDVTFYQRTWYSVKEKREDGSFYWTSSFTDTLLSTTQVTTGADGYTVAKFTPKDGGVHRVVAETTDKAGNKTRSATYVWITSGKFVNWRQENNDRVELVADKKLYNPGDVAEILIPAPFENSEALLTVERGKIRKVERLTLKGNSETIKLPIDSDYSPNVYVSVMLVKGLGPDSPFAQFKIGYTNLQVSTKEKLLDVKVTPDKTGNYQPRQSATYTVEVKDAQGKPVRTELSLALVDKAVLSLSADNSTPLDQVFYGQRMLGVGTASSLSRNAQRLNEQLAAEKKGGGGGSQADAGLVRRVFRDTAYWNAALVTDENGKAQVSITLPDNLTTWQMAAKGVTGADTLVGTGKVEIVSTKDVLVRPVTPRFAVVGDNVQLESVVNNNTDKEVKVDVTLEGKGFTISGQPKQPLTVPARGKAKVAWQTTVPGTGLNPATATGAYGEVLVRMTAQGSGYNDSVELTLPVYQFSTPEVVSTAGQVDQTTTEQIKLPAKIDTSQGDLTVEVNPSLAAASVDSLKWLEAFEYDCTEQTVSKFLPNIATYRALKELGLDKPELRTNLETQVAKGVQRLYALQHNDGGWGWFLADESQPWTTAYALYGLTVAEQSGFAVEPYVTDRATEFLTGYLDKPVDVAAEYDLNQRAFIAYVLAERGKLPDARAISLYDRREPMSQFGRAFLALALQKAATGSDSRIKGLVADFAGTAKVSATGTHWEEKTVDYRTMNTNTRTTAIVLMALARLDPENASLPNAVRWLMVARKEGHWETTQETVWSVLALTDFMKSTGELKGEYTYRTQLNGKVLKEGQVSASNITEPVKIVTPVKDLLLDVANELVIGRDGTGKLYYSAYLRAYQPAAEIQPMNRGIILGRQYIKVDPGTLKPTGQIAESAKVGDIVQVKLTLIAPTDLHYLLLEDALPAGFEAIDTSLKTSSAAAQGPQIEQQKPGTPESQQLKVEEPWWSRPWWMYWVESQLLDQKVAMFSTFLGKGTYEYTYLMRASVAGDFNVIPAHAEEMYFPEVFGRSAGGLFTVEGQ